MARPYLNCVNGRAWAVSNPVPCIISMDKPKQVWDNLCGHFKCETLANKLFLKKQYFRTEMKEDMSMEVHLKQMKEITDKLAAIGAPISEEDQVVTLLGSLPQGYSSLVTALEARVDNVRLNYVQQALIHEEKKRQGFIRNDKQPMDSALVGAQEKRRPVKCFGCGGLGHFRRNCPKRSQFMINNPGPTHRANTSEEYFSDSSSEVLFAASIGSSKQMNKWLVDSGASSHMTREKDLLTDYREFESPEKVGLGDGKAVEAVGVGIARVRMMFNGSSPRRSQLHHVLYVPKLTCNLFSVPAAAAKGNVVNFGHSKCWIRDGSGKLKGTGSLVNRLYQLDCEAIPMDHASVSCEQSSVDRWHLRLGHLNGQQLERIVQKDLAIGVNIPRKEELSFCEGCIEGKMHRKPFKPVGEIRSTRRLQLVHSDVCGPMQTASMGGKKYFVTFIDDYSRCCSVYFLRHKSEVMEKFKEFEAGAMNASDRRIGTLCTDNGGEYLSKEFEYYLKFKGIRHELTVPHSPEQNGVAERMNRTLMESARAMMSHAKLPNSYWAEAVSTAAYVRNRTPTTAIKEDKTPYERWYGKKPNVSHFKVFGCVAYSHVPDAERQKLDKKAVKLRFVGYSKVSKGYRLLDENTRKLITRRDVSFNETDFQVTKTTTELVAAEQVVDVDPGSVETPEQGEQPRRSERQRRPLVRYGIDEFADMAVEDAVEDSVPHFAYRACQIVEPQTMEEALSSDHAKEWKEAADSEYESLIENETWELVELPSGRKPIGCKWVFKVKHGSNGKVERFKGRLVAKGYDQKYGIDYDETFSPVVRFSSIRALIALAVQNGMLLHQMDVVTAFLNGKLDEEIYMQQPKGYIRFGEEHLVCKLKKSLYGLKQSPRCWNKVFQEYLESIGFKQNTADPCVFCRTVGTMAVIAVYVDDLILSTKTSQEMQEAKESLQARFKMKDMGKLHYCLGISIEQDEDEKCVDPSEAIHIEYD